MGRRSNHDDWIAARAGAQHGVIAREHLLAGGMSVDRIRSWRESGRLVDRHRGVYVLGHVPLSRHGRWLAPTLAAGPGAALSHGSAAALWGLRPPASSDIVDVVVGSEGRRRPGAGIRVHRSGRALVTEHEGIPVTTVAWTLVELGAVVPSHHLRRAVERADQLELFDLRLVKAALEVDPGRPGSPALRAVLGTCACMG
jgi:hypothetical protein